MKMFCLTTALGMLTATVCFGQLDAVRSGTPQAATLMRNSMELLEREKEESATYHSSLQSGRALFGADERWTEDKQGSFAGTLQKPPTEFRVGDWGCTNAQFAVLSVVSESECLVLPEHRDAEAMLIRGLNTSKVTDGAKFVLQHPVVIQDTYSYRAVSGARKNVLVLEANEGKLAEATAKMRALAETKRLTERAKQDAIEATRQKILNAKRRTWTSGQFKVEAEFLTAIEGKVTLRRLDNDNEIIIPMELLSKEDQEFIRERKWMAPQVIADQPTKDDTASTGRFVGRWRILNDQGVVCAYFSLTASHEARKDHAPAATATWEIVGNDARITWSDGWRDVLRAQKNETLVITFRPGTSWNDPPHNILGAVRE